MDVKKMSMDVPDFEDALTDPSLIVAEEGISKEISELSKKGYSFLKENKINYAIDSFKEILNIEDNNNYALVGLGDCERKRGNFKEAVVSIQSACPIIRGTTTHFLDLPTATRP